MTRDDVLKHIYAAVLKRIEELFCKNERAVIQCRLEPSGILVTLVPVAAILVASIRLRFLDVPARLERRGARRGQASFDRRAAVHEPLRRSGAGLFRRRRHREPHHRSLAHPQQLRDRA